MLGDNPEKSKNPLKKAIRRRNAKTVQFAAPTYVEASDMDYSSEEEEDTGEEYLAAEEAKAEPQEQDQESADEDTAVAEPLNPGGRGKDPSVENQNRGPSQTNGTEQDSNVEKARNSEEIFDGIGIKVCFFCMNRKADRCRRELIWQIKEGNRSEHRFILSGRQYRDPED